MWIVEYMYEGCLERGAFELEGDADDFAEELDYGAYDIEVFEVPGEPAEQ